MGKERMLAWWELNVDNPIRSTEKPGIEHKVACVLAREFSRLYVDMIPPTNKQFADSWGPDHPDYKLWMAIAGLAVAEYEGREVDEEPHLNPFRYGRDKK